MTITDIVAIAPFGFCWGDRYQQVSAAARNSLIRTFKIQNAFGSWLPGPRIALWITSAALH